MDTICRCAFSIETNAHEDQNHSLVKAGRDAFQGFQLTSWIESMFLMLFYFFPGLDSVIEFYALIHIIIILISLRQLGFTVLQMSLKSKSILIKKFFSSTCRNFVGSMKMCH